MTGDHQVWPRDHHLSPKLEDALAAMLGDLNLEHAFLETNDDFGNFIDKFFSFAATSFRTCKALVGALHGVSNFRNNERPKVHAMSIHLLVLLICQDKMSSLSEKSLKLFYQNMHLIAVILFHLVRLGGCNMKTRRLCNALFKNLIAGLKNSSSIRCSFLMQKDLISELRANPLLSQDSFVLGPFICIFMSSFEEISFANSALTYVCEQIFSSSPGTTFSAVLQLLVDSFSSKNYHHVFFETFLKLFSRQVLRNLQNTLLNTRVVVEKMCSSPVPVNFEKVWNQGLREGVISGLKSTLSSARIESAKIIRILLEKTESVDIVCDVVAFIISSGLSIDVRLSALQAFHLRDTVTQKFKHALVEMLITQLIFPVKTSVSSPTKGVGEIKIPDNVLFSVLSIIVSQLADDSCFPDSLLALVQSKNEIVLASLASWISLGFFSTNRDSPDLPPFSMQSNLAIWQVMTRSILLEGSAQVYTSPVFKSDFVKSFSEWALRLPPGNIIPSLLLFGFVSEIFKQEPISLHSTSILQRLFPVAISYAIAFNDPERAGKILAVHVADRSSFIELLFSCKIFHHQGFTLKEPQQNDSSMSAFNWTLSVARFFSGLVAVNQELLDPILEHSFVSLAPYGYPNIWSFLYKYLVEGPSSSSINSWLGQRSSLLLKCIEFCKEDHKNFVCLLKFIFANLNAKDILLKIGHLLLLELPFADSHRIFKLFLSSSSVLQEITELYYLFGCRIIKTNDPLLIAEYFPHSLSGEYKNLSTLPALLLKKMNEHSSTLIIRELIAGVLLSAAFLNNHDHDAHIAFNDQDPEPLLNEEIEDTSLDVIRIFEVIRGIQLVLHAQTLNTQVYSSSNEAALIIPTQVIIKLLRLVLHKPSPLLLTDHYSALGAMEDLFSDNMPLLRSKDQQLVTFIESMALSYLASSSRLSALILLHVLTGLVPQYRASENYHSERITLLIYCCIFENAEDFPEDQENDESKIDNIFLSSRICSIATTLFTAFDVGKENFCRPLLEIWRLYHEQDGTNVAGERTLYTPFVEWNVAKALSTQLIKCSMTNTHVAEEEDPLLIIEYVSKSYFRFLDELISAPGHLRHRQETLLLRDLKPRKDLCSLLDAFWGAISDQLVSSNSIDIDGESMTRCISVLLHRFYEFICKGPLCWDPSLEIREKFSQLACWITHQVASSQPLHVCESIQSLFESIIKSEDFTSFPKASHEEMKTYVCSWLPLLNPIQDNSIWAHNAKIACEILGSPANLISKPLLTEAGKLLTKVPLSIELFFGSYHDQPVSDGSFMSPAKTSSLTRSSCPTPLSAYALGVIKVVQMERGTISMFSIDDSLSPAEHLSLFDAVLSMRGNQSGDGPWGHLFLSNLTSLYEIASKASGTKLAENEEIILGWAKAAERNHLLFQGRFIDALITMISSEDDESWKSKILAVRSLSMMISCAAMEGRIGAVIEAVARRNILFSSHRTLQQTAICFLESLSAPKTASQTPPSAVLVATATEIVYAIVDAPSHLSRTIGGLFGRVFWEPLPRATTLLLVLMLRSALGPASHGLLNADGRRKAALFSSLLPMVTTTQIDLLFITSMLTPYLLKMAEGDPIAANRLTASRALASIVTAMDQDGILSGTFHEKIHSRFLQSNSDNASSDDIDDNCLNHPQNCKLPADNLHLECQLWAEIKSGTSQLKGGHSAALPLSWILLTRGWSRFNCLELVKDRLHTLWLPLILQNELGAALLLENIVQTFGLFFVPFLRETIDFVFSNSRIGQDDGKERGLERLLHAIVDAYTHYNWITIYPHQNKLAISETMPDASATLIEAQVSDIDSPPIYDGRFSPLMCYVPGILLGALARKMAEAPPGLPQLLALDALTRWAELRSAPSASSILEMKYAHSMGAILRQALSCQDPGVSTSSYSDSTSPVQGLSTSPTMCASLKLECSSNLDIVSYEHFLAELYCIRLVPHISNNIRSQSLTLWKVLVEHSPRTIFQILGDIFRCLAKGHLLFFPPTENVEKEDKLVESRSQEPESKAMAELFSKFGDKFIEQRSQDALDRCLQGTPNRGQGAVIGMLVLHVPMLSQSFNTTIRDYAQRHKKGVPVSQSPLGPVLKIFKSFDDCVDSYLPFLSSLLQLTLKKDVIILLRWLLNAVLPPFPKQTSDPMMGKSLLKTSTLLVQAFHKLLPVSTHVEILTTLLDWAVSMTQEIATADNMIVLIEVSFELLEIFKVPEPFVESLPFVLLLASANVRLDVDDAVVEQFVRSLLGVSPSIHFSKLLASCGCVQCGCSTASHFLNKIILHHNCEELSSLLPLILRVLVQEPDVAMTVMPELFGKLFSIFLSKEGYAVNNKGASSPSLTASLLLLTKENRTYCECLSCFDDDISTLEIGPCVRGPPAAARRILECSTLMGENMDVEAADAAIKIYVGALVSPGSGEDDRLLCVKGLQRLLNAAGGIDRLAATPNSKVPNSGVSHSSPLLSIAGPLIRLLGERLSPILAVALLDLLVEDILMVLPVTIPAMRVFGPQLFRCLSKWLLNALPAQSPPALFNETEVKIVQLASKGLLLAASMVPIAMRAPLSTELAGRGYVHHQDPSTNLRKILDERPKKSAGLYETGDADQGEVSAAVGRLLAALEADVANK
ncbi:hypothetical protein DI09_51p60 [Mitosporidium daphniae]|uniref:Uncharacterized protein n=1 Tax=Mitosporidium daphniae TaxID=1485682 RepID=A0A098VPM3_9MICR|nr:uncharacterized protein DI09_51p60 [Mitosporidium daphniae]KGG50880.1 hypothetical protein DI09_51p60 [Mitosporidium daphniae]|eukprot:XP_013237322.1 uncharacterized protein DI09_51p60 [Mitosporidium daphniae]